MNQVGSVSSRRDGGCADRLTNTLICSKGVDDPHVACGDGSDCINRLTQVECQEDDCRCRSHCQNQR